MKEKTNQSASVIAMERGEIEIFERNRIAELKKHLFGHKRSMKQERRKLWESEKVPQEGYTVWDRSEVLSIDILGYVSQSTTKGYEIESPYEVISHLHKLIAFSSLVRYSNNNV